MLNTISLLVIPHLSMPFIEVTEPFGFFKEVPSQICINLSEELPHATHIQCTSTESEQNLCFIKQKQVCFLPQEIPHFQNSMGNFIWNFKLNVVFLGEVIESEQIKIEQLHLNHRPQIIFLDKNTRSCHFQVLDEDKDELQIEICFLPDQVCHKTKSQNDIFKFDLKKSQKGCSVKVSDGVLFDFKKSYEF